MAADVDADCLKGSKKPHHPGILGKLKSYWVFSYEFQLKNEFI